MDEECCWSTKCGRGRGCEAPKVIGVGEVKCGNEGIATPGAPLDDDGYSAFRARCVSHSNGELDFYLKNDFID